MALMLAPLPSSFYTVSSGAVYTSDSFGLIKNVNTTQDQQDLIAQGCAVLSPPPTDLLFYLQGANFNVTTDQQLTPTFVNIKYRIKRVVILNASVSLTAAVGGFYSAAAKAGTPVVANSQVYSSLTAGGVALEATLNSPGTVLAAQTPLFLSLTTPQGAAATADIFVYGDAYA